MKRILLLSLVLLLALTAFGGVMAQDESILVIGFEQEPPNLQPINSLAFSGYLEGFYTRDLWDWDAERNIYPIMVDEIPTQENGMVEFTDDGKTVVTVTLKEGIVWSDGTPITTADCEISHRLRADSSTSEAYTNRANYASVVESFEIVDDRTFVLTYNSVFPDYLAATEKPECRFPAHLIEPMIADGGVIEDSPYFTLGAGPTIGYGPYILTEWNIGENMVFERNENWDGVQPVWDSIIATFITDDAQMRNAMSVGEIDMSFNWSDDQQPVYAGFDNTETFATPGVFTDALWIRSGPNGADPARGGDALQDPLVRQAIVHAIDRPTIAEQLVAPGIRPMKSWYPEILWPEDLPFLEYDPDLARDLLAQAGWEDTNGDGTVDKDGVELANLRFGTTENELRNNYQLVMQEYLAEVGIGTEIQIIPATIFFAGWTDNGTLTTYQWDLALFANSADPLTPIGDANSYHCDQFPSDETPDGFNPWQFCDPRYDEVDDLIAITPPGPERDALVEEAVTRFNEGYFWFGLRERPTWYAVNTTVLDAASVEANLGNLSSNYFWLVENWQPGS